MAAHQLPDVTVVADAGMVSEANQKQIEAAGLSFILGPRIPEVPYVVAQWRRDHPGENIPDGQVFTQSWPAGPNGGCRDQLIYYQYRHDRARRTLRGIGEQVAKAEKAVTGQVPIKRNRFIQLSGDTHTVNRELETKARALAGIKGYITNLAACPDGTPITAEFAWPSRWVGVRNEAAVTALSSAHWIAPFGVPSAAGSSTVPGCSGGWTGQAG